jgi:phospholipid transport system substrate-binding protein
MSHRLRLLLVGCAIAGLCSAAPRDAFAAADTARAVIAGTTKQAIAVLQDKSLTSPDKVKRLENIAYDHFDFDTMSRLVLARNWAKLSPDQQKQFIAEFRKHLSVTYGKNVDNYRNETIEVLGDREEARGDWTVKTRINRGGGSHDILVDYRLRKTGDTWEIIDVTIEGVSLIANFRSQFQDILASKSPRELIDLIHDKNVKGETFKGEKKA